MLAKVSMTSWVAYVHCPIYGKHYMRLLSVKTFKYLVDFSINTYTLQKQHYLKKIKDVLVYSNQNKIHFLNTLWS